jgi:hypothetical protein
MIYGGEIIESIKANNREYNDSIISQLKDDNLIEMNHTYSSIMKLINDINLDDYKVQLKFKDEDFYTDQIKVRIETDIERIMAGFINNRYCKDILKLKIIDD